MGAIYKGKWSYDNQNDNLERSLMYYNAGRKRWLELIKENKAGDNGYCAINAAFILDLLASNKIAFSSLPLQLGILLTFKNKI